MDVTNSNYISTVNVSQCELIDNQEIDNGKKIKIPRKTLHFSDGTIEEYSTDEEDVQSQPKIESLEIDTKSLSWGGWFGHWAKHTGKAALDTCDSVGGSIASFLGITSPKYFYEIEEYNRMMKEESDEKVRIDEEMAGWSSPSDREESNVEIYKISSGADLPLSPVSPQNHNGSDCGNANH